MHVLWVNDRAGFAGGCERYAYMTAALLAERGVTSSLLYDSAYPADPAFLARFRHAFPRVDIVPQTAALQPDLIYAHQVNGVGAIEALRATGIPVLRFFHDHRLFCLREHKYTTLRHRTCTRPVGLRCYPCLGFLRRGPTRGSLRIARLGVLRAELDANRRLTGFVTGSQYMARHAARHGFDPARLHVLPLYAMPPAEAEAAPRPEARENGLLLFTGALLRGKGLDLLLHAMARLERPARLIVCGDGRQEGLYRRLCAALGLSDRVTFAGRVTPTELAAFYRRAQCLVVPSRIPETFGLVGPEAMSYGTPVVAAEVGGITEWLEDGVTGLAVPPNDPAALAQAIDTLQADPALADRLGATARRRYFERFTPERHADGLLRLFERVVAAARGSADAARPEGPAP